MHQHAGLSGAGVEDQPEATLQLRERLVVERVPAMAFDVPGGEEFELALQQRAIVGRHAGLRFDALQLDQGVERGQVERVGLRGVAALQRFEVRGGAQVGEQHEAVRLVPAQHLGRLETAAAQQCGHADERPAVLLGGGRVHHDARTVASVDAEVAPEAGIGARCAQAADVEAVRRGLRAQPMREGLLPNGVGPADRCGCGQDVWARRHRGPAVRQPSERRRVE